MSMAEPNPDHRVADEKNSAAPHLHAPNRRDDFFYEELSRTNNELTNLQREMARRNAELAAAQAELQRLNADLEQRVAMRTEDSSQPPGRPSGPTARRASFSAAPATSCARP